MEGGRGARGTGALKETVDRPVTWRYLHMGGMSGFACRNRRFGRNPARNGSSDRLPAPYYLVNGRFGAETPEPHARCRTVCAGQSFVEAQTGRIGLNPGRRRDKVAA
ncbi:hypothetical protein Aut01nite_11170 [Actinoplanes utahensis]|nr:hypothetical protein Aut01nite_11170 [Actinoplanes utahensis]